MLCCRASVGDGRVAAGSPCGRHHVTPPLHRPAVRITAHGSKIDLAGEREYPDNMMVAYQFADDRVLLYEDRGWTPYGLHGYDSGNAFYGTEGYMIFTRRGFFEVRLGRKEELGPTMRGGAGMPEHVNDFLDCVRSRKRPITNEEVGGRSAICCHLLNQAYYNHATIDWNPKPMRFAKGSGNPAWLTREYRGPWKVA